MPEGAAPFTLARIEEDGTLRDAAGASFRLAGLVWPDRLEAERRKLVRSTLLAALEGETLSLRPAGPPDRWGITPIHLFAAEAGGNAAPFWVQGGIAERGLLPGWPELDPFCWRRLMTHERVARHAHRGFWAPRAQAARHRAVAADPAAHLGRPMVARWRVRSTRRSAILTYVNIVPFFRVGPSLGLTARQAQAWTRSGRTLDAMQGRVVVARFLSGPSGLLRARLAQGEALMLDED